MIFAGVPQVASACDTSPVRHLTWSCAAPETERSLALAAVLCERCTHQPDCWARLVRSTGSAMALTGWAGRVTRKGLIDTLTERSKRPVPRTLRGHIHLLPYR